jgi:hypothetical protein
MNDKRGNPQRQSETAANSGEAAAELPTKSQRLKSLSVREETLEVGTQRSLVPPKDKDGFWS